MGMKVLRLCLALLGAAGAAAPQASREDFRAPGGHPSLLLTPARLHLLRREQERQSPRWRQFQSLVEGKPALPEPGFAEALYYQVSGDASACRRAVAWALEDGAGLRQSALVFDWCQPVMTEQQSAAIAARLARAIRQEPADAGVEVARSRVFAAIALADREPAASAHELRRIVVDWWRGQTAPALAEGRDALPRASRYALFEMLHAVRDNLDIDLRESARAYFSGLPATDLLSYYPAPYAAPENEYRIPASPDGGMDARAAAAARAADLAAVAYDTSSLGNQYLQGWLMHDRFAMRGAFGAPYEFLWANPYQPGLSYYHAPLAVHNGVLGQLFARSGWDDDARWVGWFAGRLQTFSGGRAEQLGLASPKLLDFDGVVVAVLGDSSSFSIDSRASRVFLVGLQPRRWYQLRIDHRWSLERTDPGGIVELELPEGFLGVIRIRESASQR
jgi:hypothetical protein